MAGTRIFDVSIVSGTSHSLYTIYYDAVNASNIATRVSTSNPATGVTYNDLTSGGVRVQVPDTASTILLYNDSCLVDDQIILPTPTPTPSPTPSSTPTPTPTATPNCDFGIDTIVTTPTPTPSPSPTNTPTPTGTPTPTPTATPNCDFGIDTVVTTPTPTPSPSPTNTPTPSPTTSPTPTPSPSPSPTETPTPTPSPTTSPTPTPTGTPTPTPTATPNCDFGVDVDINVAPTGFTPTLLTQTENTATGTTIATLSAGDPDSGNTHTFSLVSGSGSTDNGSFTLSSAGVLKNAIVFDYETKNSYSIRIRVTDQGGLYHEEIRTVSVLNTNETPYGLTLSNNTQNENTTTGTTIGTFTGLDYDPLETFTYSLIDPGGNSDESKFTLSSAGVLKNAIVFDYETKNSYTITVRVTDSANNYYEDDFTININDVNEVPTSLSLSSNTIQENKATGTTIGTFTANDPDATETLSYELVSGLGDTNNGSFNLTTGGTLTSAEVFDRETKSSYSIRVKVTDKGNLTYTGIFTIIITNQNEAPYGLTLSSNTIQENKATGTTIGTFTALDYDSGDSFTFELSGTGNDNNSFTLTTGGTLSSAEEFNYEVKNSYTIGVTVTDSGGLTYTDTFDISVTNVNETPTDIGLSNSSILENQSSGTTVGTFSTTDPDANNTFTYTLVTGTGSNDNTSFIIDGSTLKSAAIFDYETKNSYSIRVRSTDQGGLFVEKVISISVTNQNEGPGLISPTSVSFAENQNTGTTITTFSSTDPDANTTLTWTLVSGTGDTDNDTFNLSSGGTLTSTIVHNYEVKNSYSIRVRVSDGSLSRTQVVTVNITNVNETPTDISLSNSSVAENSSTGTTVGTFTTTDPDANNTFTYALVTGTGDTDNASFYVTGVSSTAAVLKTSETFNYEVKNSYSIRVRSTDQGGLTREETFTITVTNVNETPTNIALSNSSVDENLPTGTTVGTLSTTDPDANNTFTYTLVTGTGSNDNTSFYIDGDVIKTSETFDYETKSTYKCRVRSTDQGGEWFEKAFTILITNITVSGGVSITNPSCNGLNGTITVTGTTGGSSPYTYSTDAINYQSSTSFSKPAGNYTIFIKDSNDEVGAVFATITEPPLLSISIQDYTIPSCSYEDDGVITVTATGGTGNLEYTIDAGTTYVTGTTFTGLTNGTYTIRVRDSLGCAKTVSQTLNRTAITSTISTTNLDCNGDGSGEISVGTPSGGTGTGYKVKLNSGGTYETITSWPKVYSSLAAGTYHIFIKDSNECEFMFTRVITQPSVLNIAEDSKTYPNCWNSTNGALSVTASGGTTPYTYSLDDVTYQSSASFTGLTEGVYIVRVKDNKGCKDTVSIDISRDPVAATINTTGTTCNGYSDGAISVTNGSGGTGTGYEVKLNSGSYATVPQTYTGLTAGSYTITVKDSLGCTTTYSPTVSQPASVSVSTTFTNPTCSSDTNGSITVTASGGNGSYEYSINGGDYQTSNQFTNLGTGTYTLTVRDGNGCTGSNTRTLTKTSVSSAISITGVTCNGGTNGRIVAGTPSGGNGPTYQYRWQGGSWTTFNSSVTFSNLSAGTYTFEVKDVSGCTTTYSPTVSQPTAVVASASVTHPTCWNGTGSVTLSASGGTGSKVYSIDGVNYYVSGAFSNLSTGNYTGYAKDANQCVDTVSFSVTKSMPSATVTQTNIACNGDGNGTITVSNPTGGNGGGTAQNYDVKLNSGSWISFSSTSYQFTGLNGGIHNIYIRDNSDCVSNAIGVYITEPSAVNAGGSGTAPTCDGGTDGSITWTRSGGVGGYTYTVNGSEITNLTQTNLGEGGYTFVVTDGNGCSDSHYILLSKSAVSPSLSVSSATCNGGNGSITVNSISGGNGGTYRHRLNNGNWSTTLPYTYSSLPAATYTIYVEDGVGCQNSYSRTVSQPASVTFTTSSSAPTCYNGSNGSITVTASGGNGSYQYQINSGTWQSSNTFSSLSNGTYLIRVRDTNSCYSSVSSVTLNRTAPSASFTTVSTSCYGGSDGSIIITNATGGSGGAMQSYQHKLNSGSYAYFQSTSYTYSNLSGGSKTIWIKDSSGCEKSYTVTVPQPSALTATVTSSTNGPNGSLTVTSAGGTWNKTYRLYQDTTSPYTVGGGSLVATISNVTSSNPSQTFSNLAGGYYYVIVTDANGCTASTTIQDLSEAPAAEAVYQITSCTNGTVYWASVQNFCIDGVLSLAALNYNIGQVVQFSVGVDCPNPEGSTYCGTITGQGVESPTAIITNEGAMSSCSDFRCFE